MIVKLREHEVPYLRVNGCDILSAEECIKIKNSGVISKFITIDGHEVDLGEIEVVWYRRSIVPVVGNQISEGLRGFARNELKHLYEGLFQSLSARWVNPMRSTEIGERKLLQLTLASQLGLQIPMTMVTTDPREIIDFSRSFESGVICKPISNGFVRNKGGDFAIYTRSLQDDELHLINSKNVFPTLVQERVRKTSDARVTVIGSDMFAASIETAENALDWRTCRVGVTYSKIEVPTPIESGIRRIMQKLDLLYGALDFGIGENGDWTFFEINPVGEWAWLEEQVGFPLRDAFIKLFTDKMNLNSCVR